MTRYSKFNMVYRLQKWMDSVPGQTFLNYAYSWGAAVVILGTLFKLTHLPGANLMLYLGMGTEVVVFFLSAFDRPFDKTADGMDLPTHVGIGTDDTENTESTESAALNGGPAVVIGTSRTSGAVAVEPAGTAAVQGDGYAGGGYVNGGGQTIIIGGGNAASAGTPVAPIDFTGTAKTKDAVGTDDEKTVHEPAAAAVPTAIPPLTPDMTEATNAYVEELKNLTEVLERVSEQSRRLTTDSEEMENLNRTLTGICKVYEMQLKSASSQIGTIDEINEQTKRLAQQITELNAIYERMIQAMSVRQALQ